MAKGRALKMTKPSGPPEEVLALIEVDRPSPGPGEVLIRMKLRVIHPLDFLLVRLGHPAVAKFSTAKLDFTPAPGSAEGIVPGVDGYGVVEEVGEGVAQFRPGQRVVPNVFVTVLKTGAQGAWQDFVVVPEHDVYALPDSVDDSTASQMIGNPWTAFALVKSVGAPAGEYIVSTAAGSAVGKLVVQLAKHWGIKTINVVRHDGYTEELKALGADVVINSSIEDVAAKVIELTGGRGAFAAVDAIGGMMTKTLASCVRDEGEVLVYSDLGGRDVTIGMEDLSRRVKVSWWDLYHLVNTAEKRRAIGPEVLRLFAEGILAPMPCKRTFRLEDWQSALAAAEATGAGNGKVLFEG